ncbi:cytochrome P450 [Saccharopolyspora gloriosae]|uniref:Cytochrome P450 n=1 Tax=Saccharopolyspora gloriosae TaxID=455344 RepID=A0A840NCD8_9PSEU|nr:cytochrome P450 [Saccharopolyspora gloriosae]MBB5069956.1 cytochrome P450 [Saccharopolyspora gloriosae]
MSTTSDRSPATDSDRLIQRPLPPELLMRGDDPFSPPPGLDRLHERAAVSPVELLNGARIWMVTGFAESRAVLTDERFSADTHRHPNAMQLTPNQVVEQRAAAAAGRGGCPATEQQRTDGLFIFMDPPEQTRLRRLLVGQFTVRRMRALEARVREITVEHIEAMRAAGPRADLVSAFALPLPSLVICELLGVAYEDRAEFQERSAVAVNLDASDEERLHAQAGLYEFMRGLVADKRTHPADDLISGLVHGDADPALTDEELVDLSTMLLGAGHETTANMLALGTYALLEHPEQLAALRADPGLIDTAVEELLRYLSVIHTGPVRVAVEDLVLGDVTIPAGDTVMISLPEANRDTGQWPDPAELDLTRVRNHHLAFGHGVHQCLGQQLARVELRIGLAELLARLPGLRLDASPADIGLRTGMIIYGVHSLPVTWD